MCPDDASIGLNHRTDTGRSYRGRAIHAADGVHEAALTLCQQFLRSEATILELGAGSGALAARFRDAGFNVVATDLEPASEDVRSLDLERLDADVEDWVAGLAPDAIVAVEIVEHLENPRAALRQIRKLLPPGGVLVLSTPHVNHPASRVKALLTGDHFMFGAEQYYVTGHIAMLPDWLLAEHLRHAGFELTSFSFAGDAEFTGPRRLVFKMLTKPWVHAMRRRGSLVRGDGVCLFIVAKAS